MFWTKLGVCIAGVFFNVHWTNWKKRALLSCMSMCIICHHHQRLNRKRLIISFQGRQDDAEDQAKASVATLTTQSEE